MRGSFVSASLHPARTLNPIYGLPPRGNWQSLCTPFDSEPTTFEVADYTEHLLTLESLCSVFFEKMPQYFITESLSFLMVDLPFAKGHDNIYLCQSIHPSIQPSTCLCHPWTKALRDPGNGGHVSGEGYWRSVIHFVSLPFLSSPFFFLLW